MKFPHRSKAKSFLYFYANYRDYYIKSDVGNVSGNRCESDCRSRGHKFDPGLVPYFHGD